MLKEVDFSEAELTGAQFVACDLRGAIFDQTNIEKADFTTSTNTVSTQQLIEYAKQSFREKELLACLLNMI